MMTALELCLVLMLFFEPPGALDGNNVKTMSKGFEQHPGIGAALFVCLAAEICRVLAEPYPSASLKRLQKFLAWVSLSSVLGILFHPTNLPNAHYFYAVCFFLSSCLFTAATRPRTLVYVGPVVVVVMIMIGKDWLGPAEVLYLVVLRVAWVTSPQ